MSLDPPPPPGRVAGLLATRMPLLGGRSQRAGRLWARRASRSSECRPMSQRILQRSQSRVAARLYDVGWNIEQLCCGGDAMPVVERLDHDRPLLCRKRAEGFQHQEVISIARRI